MPNITVKLLLLFIIFFKLIFKGNLCTYLNWPRAHRCTQCSTPRRRVSPGARKNTSTPEVVQSNSSQPPTLENLRISTPPPSKWSCKDIYLQKNIYKYNILAMHRPEYYKFSPKYFPNFLKAQF